MYPRVYLPSFQTVKIFMRCSYIVLKNLKLPKFVPYENSIGLQILYIDRNLPIEVFSNISLFQWINVLLKNASGCVITQRFIDLRISGITSLYRLIKSLLKLKRAPDICMENDNFIFPWTFLSYELGNYYRMLPIFFWGSTVA
jgi:hypothetical protein